MSEDYKNNDEDLSYFFTKKELEDRESFRNLRNSILKDMYEKELYYDPGMLKSTVSLISDGEKNIIETAKLRLSKKEAEAKEQYAELVLSTLKQINSKDRGEIAYDVDNSSRELPEEFEKKDFVPGEGSLDKIELDVKNFVEEE